VLAHSLLSRNKSDCQTDYKLRNFGNRNYLHAAAKIQLFIVGVKISKMKKLEELKSKKFTILTDEQKQKTMGGLTGTFWIGDTNISTETSGTNDLNTGWSTDSSKKGGDSEEIILN
jgi:hypothetical protein